MVGFMRQPQIINDPNAAPASMRADDVDLKAQEGDFIMGYPAMQKNGMRVRSLVEQAMLKAKDKGVQTKGYKKGDKVDILVHNKEMHIPQELVPYIEGGYAELKKLNKPSKYDEGDVVMSGGLGGRTVSDSDVKAISGGLGGRTVSDSDMEVVSAPNQGDTAFERGSWFTGETEGERIWKQASKKVKKIVNSSAFNKGKYINNMMHKETMENLKSAIEKNGFPPNINAEKLLDTSFLFNAVAGSETNFLMSKSNFATGSGKLNPDINIDREGTSIEFNYLEGTPELFGVNQKPKKYFDRPDRKLPGWKVDYEYLVDFLRVAEGFTGVPKRDGNQWVIGHGHKITEKDTELLEILNQNGRITEDYANEILAADILKAQDDARVNYNKHTNSKTFDDLDFNSKMILMEKNFHLGRGRASKYKKLSIAIQNKDWSGISEESKTKMKVDGNLEFTQGMEKRHNDFLKYFVTPFSMGA